MPTSSTYDTLESLPSNDFNATDENAGASDRAIDEGDLVRLYLDDIGRHQLLTKEQEIDLAKRIEAGRSARARLDAGQRLRASERRALERTARDGDDAWRQFVVTNLRLVVAMARHQRASGLSLLDLIQEGSIGLLRAVDGFDWRRGFKFSTYATWWIRQSMQRGVANTARTVRLPAHAHELARQIRRLAETSEAETGEAMTAEQIAAEVGVPVERVNAVRRFPLRLRSLEELVTDEGTTEYGDLVPDEASAPEDAALDDVEQGERARILARALDRLDDDLRAVVQLRFGLAGTEHSRPETAQALGITAADARRIEEQALDELRTLLAEEPTLTQGS